MKTGLCASLSVAFFIFYAAFSEECRRRTYIYKSFNCFSFRFSPLFQIHQFIQNFFLILKYLLTQYVLMKRGKQYLNSGETGRHPCQVVTVHITVISREHHAGLRGCTEKDTASLLCSCSKCTTSILPGENTGQGRPRLRNIL